MVFVFKAHLGPKILILMIFMRFEGDVRVVDKCESVVWQSQVVCGDNHMFRRRNPPFELHR